MLCDVCARIDICAIFTEYKALYKEATALEVYIPFEAPLFRHYATDADLRTSAKQGCNFCGLILRFEYHALGVQELTGHPASIQLRPSHG